MKPIIRWTWGPCQTVGDTVLVHSISKLTSIYKDKFDYFVCYNGRKDIGLLHGLPVIPLVQSADPGLCFPPSGCAWKFYPPRLNLDVHEIVLDNDVVLLEPLEEIEQFLAREDAIVVTEGWGRNFGTYDAMIPDGLKINNGFYGMPPGLDLQAFLAGMMCRSPHEAWADFFDDQGMIGVLVSQNKYILIPLEKIWVCVDFRVASHGYHFVGVNHGKRASWDHYLRLDRQIY